MRNKNIFTDLAIETKEMLGDGGEIDGVEMLVENVEGVDIDVTWVKILNKNGEKEMGKPIGNYITIESQSMKENDVSTHEKVIITTSKMIKKIVKLEKDSVILIVGLGNWNVTPDALGPKVVRKVLVTRHIKDFIPEELINSVKCVCAISPGVMGITGIETADIVKGIVKRVKPNLIIAIDALAARKTSRINATIQISDTGIAPGAGMGNKRAKINIQSMGVPVIAIGVPTVVDAGTLANDTLDLMLDSLIEQTEKGTEFYDMLKNLSSDEKYDLIAKVLDPVSGNMFVTPKEVDSTIERLSTMIANAINMALHEGIDANDINRFM